MKKVIATLTAVIMIGTAIAPVWADEDTAGLLLPPLTGGPSSPVTSLPPSKPPPLPDDFDWSNSLVTSLPVPSAYSNPCFSDFGDHDFSRVHAVLDSTAIYGRVTKNGTLYSARFKISWDYSGVDADNAGTYPLPGRIILPEGAVLAGGVKDTLLSYVTVEPASEGILLTRAEFSGEHQLAEVPLYIVGSEERSLRNELNAIISSIVCYDTEDNRYSLPLEWDFSQVPLAAGGYGIAVGRPVSTGYHFAEGISPVVTAGVFAQLPGKPELSFPQRVENGWKFQWRDLPCSPAQVKIWMQPAACGPAMAGGHLRRNCADGRAVSAANIFK